MDEENVSFPQVLLSTKKRDFGQSVGERGGFFWRPCTFDVQDGEQYRAQRKTTRRHTGDTDSTGALCTFLPHLAEAPIQQSQDKADENGLDRLQYGWLEEGRDITRINL